MNIRISLLSRRNQILGVGFHPFSSCLLLSDYKQEVAGWVLAAWREHQSPATISRRPARQISSCSAIRRTLVPYLRGPDVQFQRSACCLQALLTSCQSEGEMRFVKATVSREDRCPDRTPQTLVSSFLPKAELHSAFIMIYLLHSSTVVL